MFKIDERLSICDWPLGKYAKWLKETKSRVEFVESNKVTKQRNLRERGKALLSLVNEVLPAVSITTTSFCFAKSLPLNFPFIVCV